MIAPESAIGWTHIWADGEQIPLNDDQARCLATLGMITYSPEDGPNARVYRVCEGVRLIKVKEALGLS